MNDYKKIELHFNATLFFYNHEVKAFILKCFFKSV